MAHLENTLRVKIVYIVGLILTKRESCNIHAVWICFIHVKFSVCKYTLEPIFEIVLWITSLRNDLNMPSLRKQQDGYNYRSNSLLGIQGLRVVRMSHADTYHWKLWKSHVTLSIRDHSKKTLWFKHDEFE